MPQHSLSEFADSKRIKVKCLWKKIGQTLFVHIEEIRVEFYAHYEFISVITLKWLLVRYSLLLLDDPLIIVKKFGRKA